MQMRLFAGLLLIACAGRVVGETPSLPWQVNSPIAVVKREIYKKHPREKVAAWVQVRYPGPGLLREEIHTQWATSDTPKRPRRRRSTDNGRTWGAFEPLDPVVTHSGGIRVYWAEGAAYYDAKHKLLVSIWLRQHFYRGRFQSHSFVRTSRDLGRTWSKSTMLRYEPGDDFDPDHPVKQSFELHNQAYVGNNIIQHSSGALIHCVAHANAAGDPMNDTRLWRLGSLCFRGQWNPALQEYRWTAGKRVEVSPTISSRGLMEPEVAELTDHRVLVIWRGSSTAKTPGHMWRSLSVDGGKTLGPVTELTYDDGSRFYSPSAYHRMIRHSRKGKLYWVGNISATPPHGNSPRYPLVIAEIDETTGTLRRKTVTLIDDRQPGESVKMHLSNFSLLENRETHDLEIYLTRLGANPKDFWGSDVYKYTLTLK